MYVIPYLEKSICGASYSTLLYNLVIGDCYLHDVCVLGNVFYDNIIINDVNSVAYRSWVAYYSNFTTITDLEYISKLLNLKELIDVYPDVMYNFVNSNKYDKKDIYYIYLDTISQFINRMVDFLDVLKRNFLRLHIPHTTQQLPNETLLIEIPY